MNSSRRTFALAGAAVAIATTFSSLPAFADDASEAKEVVANATTTVSAFANNTDFPDLPALAGKAKAIIVFPQILEGGFIIGGKGGTGVLLVRDPKTGAFGQPAFYTLGGMTFGALAGGQAAQVMMLVNTQKGLDALLTTQLKLGAGASIAAGPKGAGGNVATTDIVSYSLTKGAYAGLALDGSVLAVREKLNAAFFGKPVTPVDILIKNSVSNPAAAPVQTALKSFVK